MEDHLRQAHSTDGNGKPLPLKDRDKDGSPPLAQGGATRAANGRAVAPSHRAGKPEAGDLPDLFPRAASPSISDRDLPDNGVRPGPVASRGDLSPGHGGRGTKRYRAEKSGEVPGWDPTELECGETCRPTESVTSSTAPRWGNLARPSTNPLAVGKPPQNLLNKNRASLGRANPAQARGIVNVAALGKTGATEEDRVGPLSRPDQVVDESPALPHSSAKTVTTPSSTGAPQPPTADIFKKGASTASANPAILRGHRIVVGKEKSATTAQMNDPHSGRMVEGYDEAAACLPTTAALASALADQDLSDEGSLAGNQKDFSDEGLLVDGAKRRKSASKPSVHKRARVYRDRAKSVLFT